MALHIFLVIVTHSSISPWALYSTLHSQAHQIDGCCFSQSLLIFPASVKFSKLSFLMYTRNFSCHILIPIISVVLVTIYFKTSLLLIHFPMVFSAFFWRITFLLPAGFSSYVGDCRALAAIQEDGFNLLRLYNKYQCTHAIKNYVNC